MLPRVSAGGIRCVCLMLLFGLFSSSRLAKSVLSKVVRGTKSYGGPLFLSEESWDSWEYGDFKSVDRISFHSRNRGGLKPVKTRKELEHEQKTSKVDIDWSMMSDEQVSKGIGALSRYVTADRLDKIDSIMGQRTDHVRMVFENPVNLNNLWAALRTFDSFGIQFIDVILEPHMFADDWGQKNKGTMAHAMGSQKWLTLTEHSSTTECIKKLKEDGYTIYVSDFKKESISVRDIDYHEGDDVAPNTPRKIALVFGNEVYGISDILRALADRSFFIPMKGFAESFNVSVAAAIVCSVLDIKGWLRPSLVTNLPDTDTDTRVSVDEEINANGIADDHAVDDSTTIVGDGLEKWAPKHVYSARANRLVLTWLSRTVKGAMPMLRREGLPVVESNSLYQRIGGTTTKP
jgi:tRNA (guanosine-2'-O-)-methyltransferase